MSHSTKSSSVRLQSADQQFLDNICGSRCHCNRYSTAWSPSGRTILHPLPWFGAFFQLVLLFLRLVSQPDSAITAVLYQKFGRVLVSALLKQNCNYGSQLANSSLLKMPVLSFHDPERKFLYFAFGSNLFQERLHLSCPSAARLGPGRLFGYRLTFNYNSLRWRGHVATIREGENDSLWGCIWIIDKDELEALHKQEGVHQGLYRPLNVEVSTPEGVTLPVMTYQMTLPYEDDARPSCVYKKVMVHGALESGLPVDYIEQMKVLPDNGYNGPVEVNCSLVYRQDTAAPQSHLTADNNEAANVGPQNVPHNAIELTAAAS